MKEFQRSKFKTLLLPVLFKESFEQLRKAILKNKPDLILCLGQAARRRVVSIETRARNFLNVDLKDNAGKRPSKKITKGMDFLYSKLPVRLLCQTLRECGIKARPSNSAGAYVCNDLYYRLLQFSKGKKLKACFIHLPLAEVQGGSFEPKKFARALKSNSLESLYRLSS